MKTFKQISDLISRDIIEDEVPIRHVHNGIVINKDGSMGIAIKVQFPFLKTYGDNETEALYRTFRTIYETLPKGYRIQIIFGQHSNPNQISDLKQRHSAQKNVIEMAQFTHLDNLENGLRSGKKRYFSGVLAIVKDPILPVAKARSRAWQDFKRSEEYKKTSFVGRLKQKISLYIFSDEIPLKLTEEEWKKAILDLGNRGDTIFNELRSAFLIPEFLQEEGLAELFYNFWNPNSYNAGGKPVPVSRVIPRTFTDYFLKSDLELRPEDAPKNAGIFRMDNAFHQILTLRVPGEIMAFCQWDDLLYYSGVENVRIVVNCAHGDLAKRLDKLKLAKAQTEKRLKDDPELQSAYEQIEQEIIDLGENKSKIWDFTLVVHIWHEDPVKLNQNALRLIAQAESVNGMQLVVETDAALEYWRFSQPVWARDLDRYRELSMSSDQVVTQLPVCGEQHGMDRKRIGAVLETSTGTLHNVFPHDDLIYANYNMAVIGGTRSGKTFFVLKLLILLQKLKVRVNIVDIGGSFRGLCDIVGGNYVDIDLDSGAHTINPLHLGDNREFTNEDVQRIRQVLEQMLIDRSSNRDLNSEEIGIVEDALYQLLGNEEMAREPILSDLRNVLNNFGPTGVKLANRLKRYCGTTGKGKLFDGPTKLDMNSLFTVYDLTKAVEDKDVTPLMFQILINNVIRSGMDNMGDLKILIFDECWKFLAENSKVADFVEYAFRGLAKFNFATLAITQGIEEITKIKNSSAILNNTAQVFVLKQDSPDAARQATEALGLNETEGQLIQSLQSELGYYSQALHVERLRDGRIRSTVLNNYASALEHAICTTQGRDRAKREEFISQGMSLKAAILKFAELYPHGVSQAEG